MYYFDDRQTEVQRRVRALKKYQLESIDLESKFYHRVHELKKENQPLFNAINLKREAVVVGEHEPADEECDVPLIRNLDEDELQKLESNSPIEGTPSRERRDLVPCYEQHVADQFQGSSLLFHFAGNPYFTKYCLDQVLQAEDRSGQRRPFRFCANVPCAKRAKLPNLPNEPKCQTYVPNESLFNFFDAALKGLSQDLNPNLLCMQTPKLAKSLDDDFDGFGEDEDSEDSDGDSDGDDDEDE
uniref:Uncharacterized protein n=1 Tax=Ditylenchus dipsaci TaxID=166011 RepID=A0A915DBQ2_9BILA